MHGCTYNNNRLFPLWELYGYICDLNQRLEPAKINSRIVLDGRTYSLGFWALEELKIMKHRYIADIYSTVYAKCRKIYPVKALNGPSGQI